MPTQLPTSARRRRGAAVAAAVLAAALAGGARTTDAQPAPADTAHAAHGHTAHAHGHADAAPAPLTAAARAQLAAARQATAALATPEAAVAAGFRPMFGHVPLQGEHYVRVDRVMADTFDVARPSVLMFAPVDGRPTLVGVAYAFLHPAGAPAPAGFDGAGPGVWHTHARLSPIPGRALTMMHAWFVDAPGGPFARYNPSLPFLAAGLAAPDSASGAALGADARRLGFALAAAYTPPLLFAWLDRQAGDTARAAALRARVAPHRDAVRALVPRLQAAERAGDRARYARLAREAAAHGDALAAAYRAAAPERPLAARLVDRTVDEFLGRGHGVEEELEALFAARRRPEGGA